MRRTGSQAARRHRITLFAAAALYVLCGSAIAGVGDPSIAVGSAAPDFSRPDLDHKPVELNAYRGKIVLLNFWATWCAPCRSEIPRFVEWQRKYGKRGLQIIGVAMDDEEAPVRAAQQQYGINYRVVMGDEKLAERYGGILGLPAIFMIDKSGKLRFEHEGAIDPDILLREIQTLLVQP